MTDLLQHQELKKIASKDFFFLICEKLILETYYVNLRNLFQEKKFLKTVLINKRWSSSFCGRDFRTLACWRLTTAVRARQQRRPSGW